MSTSISRAEFLKRMAAFAALATGVNGGCSWINRSPQFPCRLLGPARALGHTLLSQREPIEIRAVSAPARVVIVGGGMAGLSAAWWLKRNGFFDFAVLELEDHVGGNSCSGRNQYGSYPWGAHYVPVANTESVYVQELFKEFGIITGIDSKSNLPTYEETFLCYEPQERLLKDGVFQEGLVPRRGLQKDELSEMARFFKVMGDYRNVIGSDKRPAFAIPVDLSSADVGYRELDKISMAEWLRRNSFVTKPLLWYINYCCRDDYGSTLDHVSAWAGVHYFAGRRGNAANAELNSVVTWPEGNGFLVNKLKGCFPEKIKTGYLVTAIRPKHEGIHVEYREGASGLGNSFSCEHVVFAGPRFIAKHIVQSSSKIPTQLSTQSPVHNSALQYAPWLVANISIRSIPAERGVPVGWDNVSYYSPSLGYVTANHQEISTRERPFVITYYYPLSDHEPVESRKALFGVGAPELSKRIVADLEAMHPGISNEILSMDLWPWGHGMVRPAVGFMWSEERREMRTPNGNVIFAHSDMSGMSNFEEAQYHGVEAAKIVLSKVGIASS